MAETLERTPAPATISRSSQGLLVLDDDCVCLEASLGACRLLGVGREEVIGHRLDELLEADSAERFRAEWVSRLEGGEQDGTLTVESSAGSSVAATITFGVLPGRHLIALDPVLDNGARGAERGRPREPTAREREILALLASGATDVQIAALLNLSPATVQTHVRNAKAKMGARTRTQAVALALRRGLIPTP